MFDFEQKEFEDMIKIFKLGYHNANKIFMEKREFYVVGSRTQEELYGRIGLWKYKRERRYKIDCFNATASFFDALWNWWLQSRTQFEQGKTYHEEFKKQNEYLCRRLIQICVRTLKMDIKTVEKILNEVKEDLR